MSSAIVRKADDPRGRPEGCGSEPVFTLDPHRVCLGMAAAAKSRGGTFFERSRVTKVRAGAKQVEITVEGGLVHARTVIVCTGMATTEFKPLQRHFKRA